MKSKVIKNETYNIHLIKNNKFKKVEMKIYFKNNFSKDDCYLNTFLLELLTESTKKYPTLRELIIRTEELYNAKISGSTYRSGAALINMLSLSIIDPKYIKEKDYLNNIFELFFSIIFEPNLVNGEFDKNTIETIKQRIIDGVNANRENPLYNLILNANKTFNKNSYGCVEVTGTPEQIKNITNEDLIATYKNLLDHSYIDIYVSGDIDEDKYINLINKYACFKTIKNHEVPLFIKNNNRLMVNKKRELTKYNQSHIMFIYTINNLTNYERKYVMNAFDSILGDSSLDTKLSRKIREELSLCYSINSSYNSLDNTFQIITSVDNKNIDQAIKSIKNTFREMKNNITDSELKNAKSSLLSSLNEQESFLHSIISSNHYKDEVGLDSMEERINNYKNITKESIYKVFNKIKLNTIYVLEGTSNEED